MNRVLAVSLLLFSAAGCSDSSPERFELGQKALAAKDYDLALSCFNDYVKARPGDAKGWEARGDTYAEAKRFNEAIADFTEAIKLKPDSAASYRGRAMAYFHTSRFEEHKRDWEKAEALEKKPN